MYISAADKRALMQAADVLLRADRFHAAPDWLSAVNEAFKRLHHAPRSSFLLPDADTLHYVSGDVDPDAIAALRSTIVEVPDDGPFTINNELLRAGHIERRKMGPITLYVDARSAFSGAMPFTAYPLYTEVILPAKMGFPLGVSMPLRRGETVISMLYEQPVSSDRVDRSLMLNRELLPAFVTGIHGYLLIARALQALFASFDAMPAGIVVFDSAGNEVYGNPRWGCQQRDEPEPVELRACVRDVALRLLNPWRTRKSDPHDDAPVMPLTLHATRYAHYRAEAFYLPENELGRRFVAVHVSRRTFGLVTSAGDRYGLSRRESQVAALLIEGKTNPEIANELFLSVHTVRRHVEAILKKTKCRTRAGVQAALMTVV